MIFDDFRRVFLRFEVVAVLAFGFRLRHADAEALISEWAGPRTPDEASFASDPRDREVKQL